MEKVRVKLSKLPEECGKAYHSSRPGKEEKGVFFERAGRGADEISEDRLSLAAAKLRWSEIFRPRAFQRPHPWISKLDPQAWGSGQSSYRLYRQNTCQNMLPTFLLTGLVPVQCGLQRLDASNAPEQPTGCYSRACCFRGCKGIKH